MEDFVTYEIAVKLKEKLFKEQCLAYYTKDSNFYYNTSYGSDVENAFKSFNSRPSHICGKRIDAPIISQVLKWLRETKNIEVVASFSYINKLWGYQVGDMTLLEDSILSYDYSFPTYEEAALAGIEYVLYNLI